MQRGYLSVPNISGGMSMANNPNRRVTEKEFLVWCDSETWAEWVNGVVIELPSVTIQNGQIFCFLLCLLAIFVDGRNLGKVLARRFQVRFAKQRTRRSPDLFYVNENRQQIIREFHIEGAPDLILEIISPDSQSRDRRDKFHEYESAGVMEYWIVDPLQKPSKPTRWLARNTV
jgi:Uma2 family endonuclease